MHELDDGHVISAGPEAGEDVIHSIQLDPAPRDNSGNAQSKSNKPLVSRAPEVDTTQ